MKTGQFTTKDNATVTVTPEGIKIRKLSVGGLLFKAGSHDLDREDVTGIVIGDADRQYVTGKRAVGVVLTGGLGLLAPSKMTARIAIGTTSGVIELTLGRSEAKRITSIEALFRSAGYEVVS